MQDYLLLSQQSFSTLGTFARWANQAVLEMLEEIHRTGGDADKYLAKAKDKMIHSV
jgi:hypothetical protein